MAQHDRLAPGRAQAEASRIVRRAEQCAVDKQVGRRIALLRELRDMTQVTLADHLGVTQAFLSQIENGRAVIRLALLLRICATLRIDLRHALGPELNPQHEP